MALETGALCPLICITYATNTTWISPLVVVDEL